MSCRPRSRWAQNDSRFCRSTYWSQEGGCGEDGESKTSFLGREHVGNNTSSISERRRPKGACEEPKDKEGLDVLCSSSTGIEDTQGTESDHVEDLTAEQLRQWCPKQGT